MLDDRLPDEEQEPTEQEILDYASEMGGIFPISHRRAPDLVIPVLIILKDGETHVRLADEKK